MELCLLKSLNIHGENWPVEIGYDNSVQKPQCFGSNIQRLGLRLDISHGCPCIRAKDLIIKACLAFFNYLRLQMVNFVIAVSLFEIKKEVYQVIEPSSSQFFCAVLFSKTTRAHSATFQDFVLHGHFAKSLFLTKTILIEIYAAFNHLWAKPEASRIFIS